MSETGMTMVDEGLPERWSAQRKTEVVLRVIRGEALDEVARELEVPVHGRASSQNESSHPIATPFGFTESLRETGDSAIRPVI